MTKRACIPVKMTMTCAHCAAHVDVVVLMEMTPDEIDIKDGDATVACSRCKRDNDINFVGYLVSKPSQ